MGLYDHVLEREFEHELGAQLSVRVGTQTLFGTPTHLANLEHT